MTAQTQDTLLPAASDSGAEQTDGSVFLFISLYSLLLAFFIVLYTTAEVSAHKAEAAKASVQDSFKGDPAALQEKLDSVSGPMGPQQAMRLFYAEARKLARELLAIEETAIIEQGDTLILLVPTNLLFTPGSSEIDDRKMFLQKMADSLTTGPVGLQIDVEFRLPKKLDSGGVDTLTLHRAGAFARKLVEMGIAEETIYTGITEGTREMVEITFSPRNIADTKLEF